MSTATRGVLNSTSSGTSASAADAELIMRLYDLRREPVMRQARNWFATFPADSAEDVMKVVMNFSSMDSAYFRQVCSYWEMAASLVLHGTLNEALFFDTNGEIIFVYAKLRPVLDGIRTTMGSPEFLSQTETLIKRNPVAQKRLEVTTERLKRMAQMRAGNNR